VAGNDRVMEWEEAVGFGVAPQTAPAWVLKAGAKRGCWRSVGRAKGAAVPPAPTPPSATKRVDRVPGGAAGVSFCMSFHQGATRLDWSALAGQPT
jgi:hypothetical protein